MTVQHFRFSHSDALSYTTIKVKEVCFIFYLLLHFFVFVLGIFTIRTESLFTMSSTLNLCSLSTLHMPDNKPKNLNEKVI